MNIKNVRASAEAVRALNELADEIRVILQTDQGSRTMRDGISTRRWTRLFTW